MKVVEALGEKLAEILGIPTFADEIAAAKASPEPELPRALLKSTNYVEKRFGCGGTELTEPMEGEPKALQSELFEIEADWQLDIYDHYAAGGNKKVWELAYKAQKGIPNLTGELFSNEVIHYIKQVNNPVVAQLPVDTAVEPFRVGVRVTFKTVIHKLGQPSEVPIVSQIHMDMGVSDGS